jgi:hypothetical protein
MARRSSKELEIENAHLRGRIDELEKRTKAAEDFANEAMAAACSCDSDDVWPGDPGYPSDDERTSVSYVDDFGVLRPIYVPTGEN